MKIFSTFSGIGGFEVGILNAHIATCKRKKQRGYKNTSTNTKPEQLAVEQPTFVGYSEIDKYAISVYENHFKGVKNYGDITKIKAEELPDFDCLVGGFPCQAFSIAGRRGGFNDTRGTLFFDLARVLGEKQPSLCVFENVKGLLSHDEGKTFTTIISTLDELGYDCQWQVLNSKNFGVPQNRERVIIVGHLRGTPRPEVFPIIGAEKKDTCATKKSIMVFGSTGKGCIGYNKSGSRVYDPRGISPAVRTWQGGGQHAKILAGYTDIRRLTPLECERLQGFTDDWTRYGKSGEVISDTQRYKICGNAVTTNVIQAVFERIFGGNQ